MSTILNFSRSDFRTDTVMGFEDLIEALRPGLPREVIEKIDTAEFLVIDSSVRFDDMYARNMETGTPRETGILTSLTIEELTVEHVLEYIDKAKPPFNLRALIPLVKAIRELTGCGLKEAKYWHDTHKEELTVKA